MEKILPKFPEVTQLLTLNEYQSQAGNTQGKEPPEERVFGLLEEAGEVAGVFKRLLRGDYPPEEAMVRLHRELGDVLWYLARIAADNSWTLQDVAESNLAKLKDRQIRNQILGTGDTR